MIRVITPPESIVLWPDIEDQGCGTSHLPPPPGKTPGPAKVRFLRVHCAGQTDSWQNHRIQYRINPLIIIYFINITYSNCRIQACPLPGPVVGEP